MFCKHCGQKRSLLSHHHCPVVSRTVYHEASHAAYRDDDFVSSFVLGAATGIPLGGSGALVGSLLHDTPDPTPTADPPSTTSTPSPDAGTSWGADTTTPTDSGSSSWDSGGSAGSFDSGSSSFDSGSSSFDSGSSSSD